MGNVEYLSREQSLKLMNDLAAKVEQQSSIIQELAEKLKTIDNEDLQRELAELEESWETYRKREMPVFMLNDSLIGGYYRLLHTYGNEGEA